MFEIHRKLSETYKYILLQQIVGGSFLFVEEFFGVLPIYWVGLVLDEFRDGTLTSFSLFYSILKIMGISIIGYVVSIIWMFFVHNSGNSAALFLRRKFFASMLRKPMNFFEKYTSGDILTRVYSDVEYINGYFGGGLLLLMDSFIYPMVYIGMMCYLISWKLTLATVSPFPIITILYALISAEMNKRNRNMYEKFAVVSQEILQIAESIKLVRSFCNEQVRLKKLSIKVKLYFDAVYFKARLDAFLKPFVTFITEISTIIAFCYGGVLVYHGEITYGNLVSFFMFVYMFTWSAMASSFYIQLYKAALVSAERIVEILNEKDRKNNGKDSINKIESIEFKEYCFKYDKSESLVLTNISFKLEKGEMLGIVGKTGCGKTSLARSLLNIYEMKDEEKQGSILINDREINCFENTSLKSQLGYVSQREQVFSDTIYNNVTFFDSSYSEDEVMRVLELANFIEVKDFPEGIHTQIGERGMSLSGGQRQRLSIARALIRQPSILILDDAFSAIDTDTCKKIMKTIKNMFDMAIVITNKIDIAKEMDRIIVLNEGKIAEVGTHEELSKNGKWYINEFLLKQKNTCKK